FVEKRVILLGARAGRKLCGCGRCAGRKARASKQRADRVIVRDVPFSRLTRRASNECAERGVHRHVREARAQGWELELEDDERVYAKAVVLVEPQRGDVERGFYRKGAREHTEEGLLLQEPNAGGCDLVDRFGRRGGRVGVE